MPFPLGFIEGIGGPELMMIMFIVLLLFGANRLPELARGLGKSVREFKKAASGVEEEVRRAMAEPEEPLPKKFPTHPPARPPVPATPSLPAATDKPLPPPDQG
jgi:sec-independent protein translocase protein TatA